MTFLCSRCRDKMCSGCIDLADEYAELLQSRNRELSRRVDENAFLRQELAAAKNSAAIWERTAKLGYSEMITRWMDKEVANGSLDALGLQGVDAEVP